MIRSPRESDFPTKQEGHSSDEKEKASSSSTQLLRLKDPRIVRVSRAFGGKDRHSKVCTIRGLRDRRVRLSVPTAIQLYDLQDRLGFNQPSKVIDWLLNAAKHEIDGLPPLPVSPLNFSLISNHPSAIIASNHLRPSQFNEERFNVNQNIQLEAPNSGNDFWKLKTKEAAEEMISEKPNWTDRNDEVKQGSNNECGEQVLPNNLLPRSNHPSFLGLMNSMPLGYQWEPSGDDDISQSGNHGFTNQTDIHSNIIPSSSTLSLSTGNSQILLCPPGATQSHFSPQVTAMEMDPRQIHHYQMFSSSSQNLMTNSLSPSPYSMSQSFRPFGLSMMTPKLHSPNSRESHSRKDRDFLSK